MTIAQSAVVRALNAYCFEEIWNEPLMEYADNVSLIPVSSKFMINWIIGNKYIPLPSNGLQYAVYRVNYTLLEVSLLIPGNTWVASDVVANQYQTLFHVYANTGQMLPKSAVMLYYNTHTNMIYVAIQKAPLLKVIGVSDWSEMYMSVYRYMQPGNPLQLQSFAVPNPDTGSVVTARVNTAISNSLFTSANGTTVYVNGYDVPVGGVVVFFPGDYVDVLTDTTVIGKYSVDLTTTATGYFSTLYNTYKEVLHCPKAINPQNQIITNELLSLTARRNTDNVGLYVTKAAPTSVTQITHNDVGINTEVVEAMRAALGMQDISIEVKVRSHAKTLIREIDYIDYLYVCNDATILSFLVGTGDASLPFWTAANLEQCAYVAYMTASPTLASTQTLPSYISALGYYTVISILCQHVYNYPVTLPMSNISVPKPLILSGLPAYPVVFLNGIKLTENQVGYSNTRQDNLLIGLTANVYYTTGQTITVDVIEAGSSIPYLVQPSSEVTSITVPFSDVKIFKINTLTTAVDGYTVSSTKSITPIELLSNTAIQAYVSGTGMQVVFAPSTYGNTYIIQNGTFSRCFGFDVSSQVTGLLPIHVELETSCTDNVIVVPFVGYNSLDVYLNGNRLIPGIDYSANPINDTNGNAAVVQILICNKSFVNTTIGAVNFVEVIARTGITLENEIGYLANNIANMQNSVEFWYAGMSQAYMGGAFQSNLIDAGDSISPVPSLGNGVPFYILTEVPDIINDVIPSSYAAIDNGRITLINTYFNKQTPENNISTLIIPQSWELYSPYLTAIYADVTANNTLELFSNDPDNTLFLAQFAKYNYLIANDPTVNPAISKVDLRFCDVNPCYGTVSVPDINTYAIMRRLETLMLSADIDTLGDVVSG